MRILPVTILSGFPGAGKTTLINYVLRNKEDLRVAVIVNQIHGTKVGVQLVRNEYNISDKDRLIEVGNSSINGEDLLKGVKQLADENRFDHVIIETAGISRLLPVMQTFTGKNELAGMDVSNISRLDTLVTIVDAYNFVKDYCGTALKLDLDLSGNNHFAITDVLKEQIAFANVIVLNKTELIMPDQAGFLYTLLRKLNSKATIIATQYGRVPPNAIVNTGYFNAEEIYNSPECMEASEKEQHTPDSGINSISSFVYHSFGPFNEKRLMAYISSNFPENILRSKGRYWLMNKPDDALNWSQAGGIFNWNKAGVWWCSMPYSERMKHDLFVADKEHIENNWHEQFADRYNEIVITGLHINQEAITKELDACLSTEEEWASHKKQVAIGDNLQLKKEQSN